MKKIIIMCLALLAAVTALYAADRVTDNAGLLNAADKQSLEQLVSSIAANYKFELVIVTEMDIGDAWPMDYADDFFDYNGFGLGRDRDGCLLLVVTGSRDYWFSTSGRGIGILTPAAYNKLEDDVLEYLRYNDYAGAFRTFIQDWEEFLVLDAKGRHYNFFHEYNAILVIAGWITSLAIGFIVVLAWKSRMNTIIAKGQAAAYVVHGSLAFKEQKDRFLYSAVTKTRRESQSSSSGGRGIHTSSSGRSHGGGGGKY